MQTFENRSTIVTLMLTFAPTLHIQFRYSLNYLWPPRLRLNKKLQKILTTFIKIKNVKFQFLKCNSKLPLRFKQETSHHILLYHRCHFCECVVQWWLFSKYYLIATTVPKKTFSHFLANSQSKLNTFLISRFMFIVKHSRNSWKRIYKFIYTADTLQTFFASPFGVINQWNN